MTISRRTALLQAAVAAGILASTPLAAQPGNAYPTRPITIITPFAAGSVTDATARLIAAHLQQALGQPVVVDNRAGAGGLLAATAVAKAPADGYTLLITTNSTHSATALFKKVPYDPIKSFTPVARIGSFPSMIAVNPKLPVNTMQELVAYSKANPGKLSIAHGNSTGHITSEAIRQRTKADLARVSYRSNPAAIADLIAGHVMVMVPDFGTGMPQVNAKRIRPLAVLTKERDPVLPDVPTLHETVMPGYDLLAWVGMFGPAGMPPAVTERLSNELGKYLAGNEIRERMVKTGARVFYTGSKDFEAYVRSELVKWTDLIKEVGIPPQ